MLYEKGIFQFTTNMRSTRFCNGIAIETNKLRSICLCSHHKTFFLRNRELKVEFASHNKCICEVTFQCDPLNWNESSAC